MRKWILWMVVMCMMMILMTGGIGGCSNYIPAKGELDKSFGEGGIVVDHNAAGGNSADVGTSIYVDNKGRVYVTGYSVNRNGDYDMVIWRYNKEGKLDKTFGEGGIVVDHNAAGGNSNDGGNSIYVDKKGRIYVTGSSKNRNGDLDMVIWRYNSDGSIDKTFGEGGIVVDHNAAGGNSNDGGNSIYVDKKGRIYVTGWSYNGKDDDMVIWRYNGDGSIDKTFGEGGIVVDHNAAGGNSNDVGYSIYVDNKGRVYVTGYSVNRNGDKDMVIWRYNEEGKLDKTFGDGGIVVDNNAAGGDRDAWGSLIYVDKKGRIYVTGFSSRKGGRDMVIWRYNEEGKLDKTFGRRGMVIYNIPNNIASFGSSAYIDRGGNIYVTGGSINMSCEPNMVICKYNEDGTLDKTFANGGIVMDNKAIGMDIYVDNTGKIYVTGFSCDYSDFSKFLFSSNPLESLKEVNSDMIIWKYK
jgi:uncharacterized delta-60 repeat protein